MIDRVINVDSRNKVVNFDFTVKQLKINNPTQYPIYINDNNKNPSQSDYKFVCQPHSSITTPSIDTRVITIFTSVLDLNVVAQIVAYDKVVNNPSNNADIVPQNIGSLPSFPLTKLLTGNVSNGIGGIQIDVFKNIYFIMPASGVPCFISDGNNKPFGFFESNGGIVTYSPTTIPVFKNFFIKPALTGTYTVNAIMTDFQITVNNLAGLPQSTTQADFSQYMIASPPGFFWSYYLYSLTGAAIPAYNVTIVMNGNLSGQINTHELFNNTFVGAIGAAPPAKVPYIIPPQFMPVNEPMFIQIDLAFGGLGSPSIVSVMNKWDL